MGTILKWFGKYLLGSVLSEVFKKAAVFLTFNIVFQFLLAYVTGHSVDGLTPFNVGGQLSALLTPVLSPMVVYILDVFYVIPALYLVLNAYLARFAYRLTLGSMKG